MKHQILLGALLSWLGTLFFAFQTALVKAFTATIPPLPVVIFIQNVMALACILPFMFSRGLQNGIKTMHTLYTWLQILQSIYTYIGIGLIVISGYFCIRVESIGE